MKKRRKLQNRNKVIIFCIPGKIFTDTFLKSWTDLVVWCKSNNITPLLSNNYDPVVYYARNKVLGGNTLKGINQKPFQNTIKYDYLMWIDSDMVFSVDNFIELVNMNVPIASGLYKMSDNKHYACVKEMDDNYYLQNGSYKFITNEELELLPDQFKVDYTGFGWILFKYGVLEKLEYPWFSPHWYKFSKEVKEFTSEDVGICKNLKSLGLEIVVNKNLIIGHEKSCILR